MTNSGLQIFVFVQKPLERIGVYLHGRSIRESVLIMKLNCGRFVARNGEMMVIREEVVLFVPNPVHYPNHCVRAEPTVASQVKLLHSGSRKDVGKMTLFVQP